MMKTRKLFNRLGNLFPRKIYTLLACIIIGVIVAACGGSGGSDTPGETIEPPVSPPEVQLLEPQIGMAIFALLNPRFPVAHAVDILRQGPVDRRPAFAFTHRTFGEDPRNYHALMGELDGLNPHVQIYAICGPCRRYSGRDLVQFYPQFSPDDLNWALNDPGVQQSFINVLEDIKNTYVLPYPNSTFTIVPELESNMDNNALTITYNLANLVFGDVPNVNIVVNHVNDPGHVEALGIENIEWHTTNIYGTGVLEAGDVLNFDGDTFEYPDENGPGVYRGNHHTSWEGVKDLIRHNKNKGVMVYLWRPEWQGLHVKTRLSIDQRTYTFSSKEAYIIELLNL